MHGFCNWMGLPRVWGRVGVSIINGEVIGSPVRGKEDKDPKDEGVQKLGHGWTAAYYITLVAGAVLWWKALWVLSKSEGELKKDG